MKENRTDLGKMMLETLSGKFSVKKLDIGTDARLSKSGMIFDTESYDVKGIGHFCILRMKAMLGLMKMETVVLSVSGKDVPLLNLDRVSAFGKHTQLAELYDTQLEPWNENEQAPYQAVKNRDADIPDYGSSGHWYDPILYPCSYAKTGKGVESRLSAAACDYAKIFVERLSSLPDCDPVKKSVKIKDFAEKLVSSGGPAVNQMTKLFGKETAGRLILRHMYGVND